MKRDPSLQDLSRDHHKALFVAQQLRRADGGGAGAARDRFLDFWREHGRLHFRIEEEVLLPAFAAKGGAGDAAVAEVLRDHAEIRLVALQLEAGPPDAGLCRALGERLEQHVRLEERRLFPAIERSMDEAELEALGAALQEAEQRG